MNVGFVLLGLGSTVFAYLLWKSRYGPKAGRLGNLVFVCSCNRHFGYHGLPGLGSSRMTYMMPMGIYEVGWVSGCLLRNTKHLLSRSQFRLVSSKHLVHMKTHLLITVVCLAALVLAGTALAQTPGPSVDSKDESHCLSRLWLARCPSVGRSRQAGRMDHPDQSRDLS